jgi:threonyl-tRNA synthetase
MNKKIKEAAKDKVPFLLIAGDREVAERSVTVRERDLEQQVTVPFDAFRERAKGLQLTRSLSL